MISYVLLFIPIGFAMVVGYLLHRCVRRFWLASSLTAVLTAVFWFAVVSVILLVLGDTHEFRRGMVIPVVSGTFLLGLIVASGVGCVLRFWRPRVTAV